MFLYQTIMKNLSLTAVLTAFFASAIALGAHARDVEKIAQQGQVSVEIPNEGESWHGLNVLLASSVPSFKVAEEALPQQCTVVAIKECENGGYVVGVGSGETCAEAAAAAGAAADGTSCPKDLPPLQSA